MSRCDTSLQKHGNRHQRDTIDDISTLPKLHAIIFRICELRIQGCRADTNAATLLRRHCIVNINTTGNNKSDRLQSIEEGRSKNGSYLDLIKN